MAKEIYVKNKIAIIGSGHIGNALATGLVRGGIKAQYITVADPSVSSSNELKKLGVKMTRNNNDASRLANLIFLPVKPAVVSEVLKEIHDSAQGKVLISLAAGIDIATIKKHAGNARVARIMPNMPIAVNKGIIGYVSGNLQQKEKKEIASVLSRLGQVIKVKSENILDIITLLSGCGPGIASFLMATLSDNAKKLGLSGKNADLLVRKTFEGTLAYLAHYRISPEAMLKAVATKDGVTEAILNDLAKCHFTQNFEHAVKAGYNRIKKIKQR